ncbi:MAG: TraB/GumN family protein [Verrucomicrobiota bacterium]|nr:TraB/GumN family protein [Verrucomicrobiota bacterium]
MRRKKLGITLALFLTLASARAEPAMWVIRDEDSTIYLIGTLHLLRHDAEWNSAKVQKTVRESTELWLEIADADDQAAAMQLSMKYGMDPKRPLSSKLNAAQKEKLAKVANGYGIVLAGLEPMQPWLAAMLLTMAPLQKAGYDPNSGVDRLLLAQAKKEGDKIRGFETMEQQIRIFADLPEAEQIAFLEATLDEVEKGLDQLDRLAKAWIEGDVETIGRMSVEEFKNEAPAVYDKLLVQRNIAWADKIAEMLKGSGVQQIAVGAAHLAGPDSVQVQLAKRGIKVERY